jgi:hypothetical protein
MKNLSFEEMAEAKGGCDVYYSSPGGQEGFARILQELETMGYQDQADHLYGLYMDGCIV